MSPCTKEPYEPAHGLHKMSPVAHPTQLSFRTAAEDSGVTVLPAGECTTLHTLEDELLPVRTGSQEEAQEQ